MRQRFWNALALPGGAWLVVLFIAPLGIVLAYSFGTTNIVNQAIFGWHPANYLAVTKSFYAPIVLRTLLYSVLATLASILLGYPMAYTIARFGGRWRLILVGLVLVPWLVDYLVRIYAWVIILGDNGLLNTWLHDLGFSGSPPLTIVTTAPAVVIGLVYDYFPLMVLPIYMAVDQLDLDLIEASRDLGANGWRSFCRVIFPLTKHGVAAGCILVFLPMLGDFATAQFLGGPGTSMIGNLINEDFIGSGYPPYGAVLTMLIVIVLLVSMAATSIARAVSRLRESRSEAAWPVSTTSAA